MENMSYYTCPDCGKEHSIFGESHVEETAKAFEIPAFAKLPIDPALAKLVDAGKVEQYPVSALNKLVDTILD